ncbi:hypothetical protein [Cohnella sp. 56]|uniref:hypothetical protein n=1 Tax=Cohnella sp. 56 TaxID=3113722 RepID=UPI0030EB1149
MNKESEADLEPYSADFGLTHKRKQEQSASFATYEPADLQDLHPDWSTLPGSFLWGKGSFVAEPSWMLEDYK